MVITHMRAEPAAGCVVFGRWAAGGQRHRGAVLGASAPCIRKGGCVHGAFHQARCLDLWCSGDGMLYVDGGSAKWGRVKGGSWCGIGGLA